MATVRKSWAIFILFLCQLLVCFDGVGIFGVYTNVYIFLGISLWIAYLYFDTVIGRASSADIANSGKSKAKWVITGLFTGALCFAFVKYVLFFSKWTDTYTWSDVIPQLDALYDRFARGEQPYYPVAEIGHHPFPVYMPLHWLPIGLARVTGIDLRIIGISILCVTALLYVIYQIRRTGSIWGKAMVGAMPLLILFFFFRSEDFAVVFETPIAAYYLLLAAGLSSRNIWLTTAGIIACLLSRYTMVFWLPLFAIVLWVNVQPRVSLKVWGSVLAAILVLYVIPFYLRAPHILQDGVRYHNNTVIAGWETGASTIRLGFYLAPQMRDLFQGDMASRVYWTRVFQAVVMLALFIGGTISYFKIRAKVNFYDFSLGMLYMVVLCFFGSSPMCFRYYLVSLFFLTAALCAKTLEIEGGQA